MEQKGLALEWSLLSKLMIRHFKHLSHYCQRKQMDFGLIRSFVFIA